VGVSGLDLTGPDTVTSGVGTAQFTATARMSDGSSRDVTNEATWRTGNGNVLTVSSAGLATGRQNGETSVTASYTGRFATKPSVLVLAAGTFRLSGTVTDEGVPLSGATVRVALGTGQGQSTFTGGGAYRLYGVAGPIEVAATKAGYQELKKRFTVNGNETVDFPMQLTNQRIPIGGTYVLELTAAPNCSTLPAEVRSRRYTAVVTQTGPRLTVTLSGGNFTTQQGRVLNTFSGEADPFGVQFEMGGGFYYYYYYYFGLYNPQIAEQLSPTTQFAVGGSVRASVSGSRISGTLAGMMGTYDNNFRKIAACSSGSHQFLMSK